MDLIDTGDGGPGPVTLLTCSQVPGPFFHGTRAGLEVGEELVAGRRSNFQAGRVMNHVYFSSVVETAVWGAELSTALAGRASAGRVYVVEPPGPFEDDPNVTDKKFPGNPTRSYRTREPLKHRRRAARLAGPRARRCSPACWPAWPRCARRGPTSSRTERRGGGQPVGQVVSVTSPPRTSAVSRTGPSGRT